MHWQTSINSLKDTLAKTTDDALFLPTKERVDRAVTFLIMVIVLTLLVVPVWALYRVGSAVNQANVIHRLRSVWEYCLLQRCCSLLCLLCSPIPDEHSPHSLR